MSDKKFKITVGVLGVVNLILFWYAPDRNIFNGIASGMLFVYLLWLCGVL
jgi:hypothetical protein